ncbi:FAD-dependent monooxygenase [Heyndrickxia camelliae]|uniref:FAD-binding domain-containing protein n=1 Tax=Heyndrickxia camelliae TaxID=1707093 RepID=A0A2N3LDL1_9BACI|nr:FAD-dependent monooxygenase [Heyndrickxia camelliae]PKR82614.1 hypothetical protein CWO92_23380 [Heyndrickxia camelliae]
MNEKHIPVLIVGGGLVGLSAALFLSHHQVPYLLIERHSNTSIHPRSRGINIRAMEIMRQLGLEEEIRKAGASMKNNLGIVHAETLAQANLTKHLSSPKKIPPILLELMEQAKILSPTDGCKCTQDQIEPVLLNAIHQRGGKTLFNTELIHFQQDENKVTATIRNRINGKKEIIHADYFIAADGANSFIRNRLGIKMPGQSLGHQINMLFEADLSGLLLDGSFSICNIKNSQTEGTLFSVGHSHRFTYHVTYHPEKGESLKDFTNEICIKLIQQAIGLHQIDIKLLSILPWEAAIRVADLFQYGRIFLVGDAAHIMPPTGGFGGSTGIQDAHNLAWKLAAVIKYQASPVLLETYQTERQPIGKFTAEQAGLLANSGVFAIMKKKTDEPPNPADGLLISLAYQYHSSAVITNIDEKFPMTYLVLDGRPGTRAPHVWLERQNQKLSTLDLFGKNFVLLTELESWSETACEVSESIGVPIDTYSIHSKGNLKDINNDWKSHYGISEEGAVLVRPDGFVGWRSINGKENPKQALKLALSQLLCKL